MTPTLPSHPPFPAPLDLVRPHGLLSVCCACHTQLRPMEAQLPHNWGVSHGMCKPCIRIWYPRRAARRAA